MKNNTSEQRVYRHWTVNAQVATDTGRKRKVNEDCIAFYRPEDPELRFRKGVLAVVADGMGGHVGGAMASDMAVRHVLQSYYSDPRDIPEALVAAIEAANTQIYQRATRESRYHGMGTTCTAVVLKDEAAYCAHVGDSRLYLLRQNDVQQLTEDHSVVNELLKSGIINQEEANSHPHKNVLSRAVGVRSSVLVASRPTAYQLVSDDILLLCTDGLHSLISAQEFVDVVRSLPLEQACARLIGLANARGGDDNISVGLLHISED